MKNILIILLLLLAVITAVIFLLVRSASPVIQAEDDFPIVASEVGGEIQTVAGEVPVVELEAPVYAAPVPVTARVRMVRADGSESQIELVDGEYGTIPADFNEPLRIHARLENLHRDQPIRLEADNGGVINRTQGTVAVMPDGETGDVEFEYVLGGHQGRYTVYMTQGHRQEVLEFRIGPEPPRGEAGPPRFFNPPIMEERK